MGIICDTCKNLLIKDDEENDCYLAVCMEDSKPIRNTCEEYKEAVINGNG